MSESKAVAIQDRSKQNAIVGPITDQIEAFKQIAANLATLQLNGWTDFQKCMAACWLAHGAGMHPAIFMQNHYVMVVQGRTLVEPKWEFIVGILQSRLPNFTWKVLTETDDCAEVWMSGGGSEHTVMYTLADARRQGLLGRPNAWKDNPREMCLKQAIKRCGRRVGAAVLMDLPVSDQETLEEVAAQPTVAQVLDGAIAQAGKAATDVEFEEVGSGGSSAGESEPPGTAGSAPAKAPEPVDALRRLGVLMVRFCGKLSKALMAEKVNQFYNTMILEQTGVDPKVSFKRGEIGPNEANQLCEWLEAKLERKESGDTGRAAEVAAPEPDDEPPPAEEPTPDPAPVEAPVAHAYDSLMLTVARARKLFGRPFIKESPDGSGKFWFTDMATFSQIGDKVSIKIQVGENIVASAEKMEALNRVLAEACDAKERGGR